MVATGNRSCSRWKLRNVKIDLPRFRRARSSSWSPDIDPDASMHRCSQLDRLLEPKGPHFLSTIMRHEPFWFSAIQTHIYNEANVFEQRIVGKERIASMVSSLTRRASLDRIYKQPFRIYRTKNKLPGSHNKYLARAKSRAADTRTNSSYCQRFSILLSFFSSSRLSKPWRLRQPRNPLRIILVSFTLLNPNKS